MNGTFLRGHRPQRAKEEGKKSYAIEKKNAVVVREGENGEKIFRNIKTSPL